jgi:predicted alternative tryptophan synthase beta-subunit
MGRNLYDKNPEHPGSLGIAISERLEDAQKDRKAVYSLGSSYPRGKTEKNCDEGQKSKN